jgi:hypothetical protein
MLWWMWLLLTFAIACVMALWLARGRNDDGEPLLLDQAERASSVDRYDWMTKLRHK